MRYNYEDIKLFIEGENGNGCTLLTRKEEYIDTKQKLTIKCKCGNTFNTSFTKFKNRNKRQCNECSTNARKLKYESSKIEFICEYCGKKAYKSQYEYNLAKKHFCNDECRRSFEKRNITVYKCEYCGREFYRLKSSLGSKCFCNTKCMGKWQSLHLTGENSPSWNPQKTEEERVSARKYKAYEDWRNEVLEKYDYTCIISGQRGGTLNVHHLNGYSWDIENRLNPNNGVVLTKELHDEFHKIYGKKHNTLEQFKEFYKNKTNKEFINN